MFAILIIAFNLNAFGYEPVRWAQLAERMTGESDRVREQCLTELKATPHLADLLKAELKSPSQSSRTRMYLALDVISTLKMRELLPDLISLSENEPSGYLYNAINSMMTPQNRASLITLYQSRVLDRHSSAAAKMVLLDSLARAGAILKSSELSELMGDQAAGVQKSALSYARAFLIRGTHAEYLPLVKDQLKQGSYLLRVQALFLLREVQKTKLPVGSWREICRRDVSDVVRTLCAEKRRT